MPKINGPMITNRGAAGLLKRIPESLRATLPKVEVLDPKAREGIDLIDESLMPLAVDITTLVPDPDNARLHPERNMEAIKMSLRTYGQKKPIVVRAEDMTVAAGNGTLQAAIELGWMIIAANVTPMTDEEFTGFALADNRTAELAAWNLEVVARLERLQAERGSGVIGWSEDEVLALRLSLQEPPQAAPDDVPQPPVVPITHPGDLWILGDHRLMCGDSSSVDNVASLMNGEKAVLMATDPPYGVDFGEQKYNPRAKDWAGIKGDKVQGTNLRKWLCGILKVWFPHVLPEAAFYLWTAAMREGAMAYEGLLDSGLHVQAHIIWAKNAFALGQADYHWRHENCWYAFWKGKKHRWFGERDKTTLWEVSKVANSAYEHPMQKPVELFVRPIAHHTKTGEVVCEPFAGSGSQFIAAHQTGRRCYGMELDPVYCDVILQRWALFSGLDPVREHDGASWAELRQVAATSSNGS